jgi:hypothetical protein
MLTSSNFGGSPVSGLISYPLDDGGHVLIEVEDDIKGTVTRGLHPGEIIETLGTKFETAIEAARPVALAEFRLKLSGQAGAIIASASTKAQFRIKVVWKGKPATPAT